MTDQENRTLPRAKALIGEAIKPAESLPQTINKNGENCAVVALAKDQRKRAERQGTLAEFLLASPLRGSELDVERLADAPRDRLF